MNGRLWGSKARDWADLQEGTARPAYEAVHEHARVGAGTRLLDVGCGAGMAAQIARGRGATVAGLDASEPLLAIARERTPDGDFRHGDLEQLPWADGTFDVVTGFNSFQYAADPKRALSEAKRVAKRGAPVFILTWGKPEGMEAAAIVAALKPLMPAPPPGVTPPGPFALSDETALRAFATSAGFSAGDIRDVAMDWTWPDLPGAVRALRSSGVAQRAAENSSDEAVDRAHTEALAKFKQSDGSYRVKAVFRYLVATA